jgi:hypothetical protein
VRLVPDRCLDLILTFGVAIAISVAVWGIFLTVLTSEFGAWLRKRGEADHYARALAIPIFIDLLALLWLLFMIPANSVTTLVASIFLLVYGLINFITMIRNINGVVRLGQTKENVRTAPAEKS